METKEKIEYLIKAMQLTVPFYQDNGLPPIPNNFISVWSLDEINEMKAQLLDLLKKS